MAKNVYSLQLLRNSTVFPNKADAIAGITGSSTQDGVIKLARYTEGTATKTIFGIYHAFDNNSGYTIYDSYQEAIAAMQDQINAISGATSGATEDIEEIKNALGTGVTSGNTATQQLQALSGNSATAQSGDTSVAGAKKYTDGKIDALDYTGVTTGDAVVITNVIETDGVVSATPANVGNLKLTDYVSGSSSGDVVATDTINEAFGKIENQIANLESGSSEEIEEIKNRLGDDVTTANTVSNQLAALSGNSESTSADTSVAGAKKYADGKVAEIVDGLDYTDTAVTGNYVSKVDEVNGLITVTREALPTVAAISEAGKPITAVSESLGAISATAGTINAEYVNVTGSAFSSSTVQAALEEIDAAYKAADAAIVDNASSSANTLAKLEDIINGISADAKEYHIVKTTEDLPETVKERYSLVDAAGNVSGATIDIPKDSHIVSITYSGTTQKMYYTYIDVSGETQTTEVDMSELVLETEFASGITVTDHIAHGVVDPTSEKDSNNDSFLTVGENGFKIDGIKDEIAAASGAANTKIEQLSGKTITTVSSSNSSISATTAATSDGTVSVDLVTDASKVKMTGFTADASGFTAITTASTVTEAVKVIETEFLANEQTTAAALNDLEATKLENIVVNGVTGTFNNKIASVTIDGNDVVLGADYVKPATGTPITTADTVDAALGKLEAKVDAAVAGGVTSIVAGNGIEVNATPSTTPTVSVDLKADDGTGDNDWHNPLKFDATDQSLYFDSLDCGFYN